VDEDPTRKHLTMRRRLRATLGIGAAASSCVTITAVRLPQILPADEHVAAQRRQQTDQHAEQPCACHSPSRP